MQPYQERTKQERKQLKKKLDGLRHFIAESDVFPTLPDEEQEQLRSQAEVMQQYDNILCRRIAGFESCFLEARLSKEEIEDKGGSFELIRIKLVDREEGRAVCVDSPPCGSHPLWIDDFAQAIKDALAHRYAPSVLPGEPDTGEDHSGGDSGRLDAFLGKTTG